MWEKVENFKEAFLMWVEGHRIKSVTKDGTEDLDEIELLFNISEVKEFRDKLTSNIYI